MITSYFCTSIFAYFNEQKRKDPFYFDLNIFASINRIGYRQKFMINLNKNNFAGTSLKHKVLLWPLQNNRVFS